MKPTSLFRIASITKPFTAVAVLKLVEEGKLSLDARPFELLASGTDALQPKGDQFDERWKHITIRHLRGPDAAPLEKHRLRMRRPPNRVFLIIAA